MKLIDADSETQLTESGFIHVQFRDGTEYKSPNAGDSIDLLEGWLVISDQCGSKRIAIPSTSITSVRMVPA